jgi:probable addiction module antidote protein
VETSQIKYETLRRPRLWPVNGRVEMALETTRYDTADYLESKEDVAAYLEAVFEDGDPALFAHALGVIARSEGMTEVAKAAGLTRASLYKALSADGNPEFATVMKVIRALGLKITIAA